MNPSNTIDVLYDGNCALLCRAIHLLRRMDRRHGIHVTNIAARKFDAGIFDKSMKELIAEIHARTPDGTWLKGMDAFRLLSSYVGLGPLVFLTQIPVVRMLSNASYRWIAKRMLKNRRSGSRQPGAHAIVTARMTSNSGMSTWS